MKTYVPRAGATRDVQKAFEAVRSDLKELFASITGATAAASPTTVSSTPTGSAGGDLTGDYPSPTLKTTTVGAGTYGDSTHVARVAFDAKGRALSAAEVAIDFPAIPTQRQQRAFAFFLRR